jgi:tight adherence protein C
MTIIGTLTGERRRSGARSPPSRPSSTAPDPMRRELDKPFNDRVVGPLFERLTSLGRRYTPTTIRQHGSVASSTLRAIPRAGSVEPHPRVQDARAAARARVGLLLGVRGLQRPGHHGRADHRVRVDRLLRADAGALPVGLQPQRADPQGPAGCAGPADDLGRGGHGLRRRGLAGGAQHAGPLAEEFFRVLQEMQIGQSRADAIRAMGERSDVPELRNFSSAMVQADTWASRSPTCSASRPPRCASSDPSAPRSRRRRSR